MQVCIRAHSRLNANKCSHWSLMSRQKHMAQSCVPRHQLRRRFHVVIALHATLHAAPRLPLGLRANTSNVETIVLEEQQRQEQQQAVEQQPYRVTGKQSKG